MSSLFSSPKTPAPAPLPESPLVAEARVQEQQRVADEARVRAAQSGRRTTVFAGRGIALEEQKERVKRRGAAAEDIGAL